MGQPKSGVLAALLFIVFFVGFGCDVSHFLLGKKTCWRKSTAPIHGDSLPACFQVGSDQSLQLSQPCPSPQIAAHLYLSCLTSVSQPSLRKLLPF